MTGRERWERATEYPLLALGLAFLVAYALPIIDPDFPAPWTATLGLARWAFVVLGLAAAALLGSLLVRWSGWGLWLGTWLLWALGGLALAHYWLSPELPLL